ncbi:uncharacterized protein STEHIDRAFT_163330 [Stereum hirsutum FP-91666 SS1]|uniref:Uncharacterized protein n=1 Tax=Stereum hirsutum (strain FP-91666) TaxID=721885 RepID=R7RWM1_STEHR|nr:uncharacterized protein STEHIDRAFT_163330 [Stereum hirsutum FP-91666 SS1]EIM79771.1 hypothetical protein STEHIDRAFT_163330 [Stereum hirsutum FP-91666 SS1]
MPERPEVLVDCYCPRCIDKGVFREQITEELRREHSIATRGPRPSGPTSYLHPQFAMHTMNRTTIGAAFQPSLHCEPSFVSSPSVSSAFQSGTVRQDSRVQYSFYTPSLDSRNACSPPPADENLEVLSWQSLGASVSQDGADMDTLLWHSRSNGNPQSTEISSVPHPQSFAAELLESAVHIMESSRKTSAEAPVSPSSIPGPRQAGTTPVDASFTSPQSIEPTYWDTKHLPNIERVRRDTMKRIADLESLSHRHPFTSPFLNPARTTVFPLGTLNTLQRNTIADEIYDIEVAIASSQKVMSDIARRSPFIQNLKSLVAKELEGLEHLLKSTKDALSIEDSLVMDCDHLFTNSVDVEPGPTQVALFMGMWLRMKPRASQDDTSQVLALLTLFGWQMVELGDRPATRKQIHALNSIPKKAETVEKKFNLTSRMISFAVCTQCHCTYEAPYPQICTNRETPGIECGSFLLDDEGKPFKFVLYRSFHEYVGSLVCRRDYRDIFRVFREQALRPAPEEWTDVQDGQYVRLLKGSDGRLFMDVRGEDSEALLFSLSVDGFQIEGANIHGKSMSATAIGMSCLNLPVTMRNDSANYWLATVIPDEPNKSQIQHYIRPIVKIINQAYRAGIRYTGRDLPRTGYNVKCAVGPVVLDSPAGRTLSGFFQITSHYFCYICDCWHLENLGATDFECWRPRNAEHLRTWALRWRDAATTTERDSIWVNRGVQYSELYGWDWWDPPRQLVPEGMHGFYLRLCQTYTIGALRLVHKEKKGKKGKKGKKENAGDDSTVTPRAVRCYSFNFELPPRPTTSSNVYPGPSDGGDGDDGDDDDDIEMEAEEDHLFDLNVLYEGGRLVSRDLPQGEEGRSRVTKLRQLREELQKSANACKSVFAIHRRLTAGLRDTSYEPRAKDREEDDNAPRRTPQRYLADSMEDESAIALEFVATDLWILPKAGTGKKGKVIRRDHAEALASWRMAMPRDPPKHTWIDSDTVLSRVREAIRDVVRPSWVNSVPVTFGSKNAGHLKANQWRILWSIYIPLALLSLWIEGMPRASADAVDMAPVLENAMALVCLCLLASKRSMTRQRAEDYREEVRKHVEGIKKLFPGYLLPYHHAVFHVYDFLILYGPIASWWAFPFERLIGTLQDIPHNHKKGEAERTMLLSWTRGSRFKQWAARSDCPPALRQCQNMMDKASGKKQDTAPDLEDFTVKAVSEAVRDMTGKVELPTRPTIQRHGVFFSRESQHLGNSLIMVSPESSGTSRRRGFPAKIVEIYILGGHIKLAIYPQLEAPHTVANIQERFPHFPASIYSTSYSKVIREIPVEWVQGHCAQLRLSNDLVLVLDVTKQVTSLFVPALPFLRRTKNVPAAYSIVGTATTRNQLRIVANPSTGWPKDQ